MTKKFRLFSLEEAQVIIPTLREYTLECIAKLAEIEMAYSDDDILPETLILKQEEIELCLARWHDRVILEGAYPKGLFLIDFDHGSGYWCWRYPEETVKHEHGYNEGYSSRVKIDPTTMLIPNVIDDSFFTMDDLKGPDKEPNY